MYVDILGDKGGARLSYGGQFTFTDGQTLESYTTDHEIKSQYQCESEGFLNSIETGVKDKNNIENILESAKLLDALYKSAEIKKEISF